MQYILEFFKTDTYLVFLSLMILFLFIGFTFLLVNNLKMNKKYKTFIKKLGNSKNIQEDLENFMHKVERVEKKNAEISNLYDNFEEDLSKCVQKIGVIRYSAFRDSGSDLSFAVALLDQNDNGVVFNGIYSREMSNIYAKPIENGNSKYTLSEEEVEAIKKAKDSNKLCEMK